MEHEVDSRGKDVTTGNRFARVLPSPIEEHPLDAFMTERRSTLFRQVLARRTTQLAVVVEDCYDPHNATAVIRTCDALGIHRIHVTTGKSKFKINRRISQGAHRYVDVHAHKEIQEAYAALRADGYRIMATDLKADAIVGPHRLNKYMDNGQRLAVVFGCEGFGLSQEASDGADGTFLIPMAGFTQSLNLSVSAAIALHALRGPALADDLPGDMSADEQRYWYDTWVREQHPGAAKRLEEEGAYTPLISASAGSFAQTEGEDKRGEALDILE